MKEKRLIKAS